MLTVDSLTILNKLKIKEEGDLAYVNKEQKVYEYTGGEWKKKGLPEGKMNLSVYDMNKQIIAQMPEIDDKAVLETIRRFKNDVKGQFYMLICRDINYYTLFTMSTSGESCPRIEREVLDCLHDIGVVKSIEQIEGTETIEVWVEPERDEPLVMYFFNYDRGVITCQ